MRAVLSWNFLKRDRRAEIIQVPDPPPDRWFVPIIPRLPLTSEVDWSADPSMPASREDVAFELTAVDEVPGVYERTAWYLEVGTP